MDQHSKRNLQEEEYHFPYHYIPHFEDDGIPSNFRHLRWGYEYLCCLKHMAELVISFSPQSLLDVGCGEGRFLGMVNSKIGRLVGLDFSETSIQFAGAFNPTIQFHTKKVEEMRETFHIVTAIEVLEHIPPQEVSSFIKNLVERTSIGGHVILSVPTTVKPLTDKHYRHYTFDSLHKEIREANVPLEVVKKEYVYRSSPFLDFMLKIMINRFMHLEITLLRKIFWNYVWTHLRMCDEKEGMHLVVCLRKLSS